MESPPIWKKESQRITYIQFVKEKKRGYCDELCNLKLESLKGDELCMREHTEQILKQVQDKRGPIEKFTIGAIPDRNTTTFTSYGEHYMSHIAYQRVPDFERKVPDVEEIWTKFFEPNGYEGLVVLYRFPGKATEKLVGEYRWISKLWKPRDFARSFENSLVHYFESDRRLDTPLCFDFQQYHLESLCYAVYVAIKLKREPSPSEDETETDKGFPNLERLRGMTELPDTSVDDLIKSEVLPTQQQLEDLQREFLLTRSIEISKDLKHIGNLISKCVQKKYQAVKYPWLAYKIDEKNNPKVLVVLEMDKAAQNTEEIIEDIGYDVHVSEPGLVSTEAEEVQKKMLQKGLFELEDNSELINCIKKHHVSLMKRHSHIAIIEPSSVRSKGFQQGNQEHVVPERCVVIYVRKKGYIPFGEELLDKSLEEIPVDVLEGTFQLAAIGRPITPSKNSFGTFGGFIEHPLHGPCGITSAHVLLSDDEMNCLAQKKKLGRPHFYENGIPVYMCVERNDTTNTFSERNGDTETNNPNVFCKRIGDVIEAVCTSEMEVAIFTLNEKPKTGTVWNATTEDDEEKTFESGKVISAQVIDKKTKIIKFGAKTGKTTGIMITTGATGNINSEPRGRWNTRLTDLIKIGSSTEGPFSKVGDSGSLIMVESFDKKYLALGILVGGVPRSGNDTEYISSYATPITSVLPKFGISSLKCFTKDQLLTSLREHARNQNSS